MPLSASADDGGRYTTDVRLTQATTSAHLVKERDTVAASSVSLERTTAAMEAARPRDELSQAVTREGRSEYALVEASVASPSSSS